MRRRSFSPALQRMHAEGQQRATEKAKLRVLGAVHLLTEGGKSPFEASALAIAAETKRPLEEVRAWLKVQVTKYQAAKKKLESQFVDAEAKQ